MELNCGDILPFMLENVTAYICHSSCFGLLISGKPAPVIVYCEVHCHRCQLSSNVQDSPRFKSFVLESLMTYHFPIVCPDDDAGPSFMQLC